MTRDDALHTVAYSATSALLVELLATPKPGLVDRRSDLRELSAIRMQASAVSLYRWFYEAARRGMRGLRPGELGELVLRAVESSLSSQRGGNAHLGAVLLVVPLCAAAGASIGKGKGLSEVALRRAARVVLVGTDWRDTLGVFRAIRLSRPGGLGSVPYLDVNDERTYEEVRRRRIGLLDALRAYPGRDLVADELVGGYPLSFGTCLRELRRVLRNGGDLNAAAVNGLLAVMAERPDTHVVRRNGLHAALSVKEVAARALRAGGATTAEGRRILKEMDRRFRERDIRPGSSADVLDAALTVLLLVDRVRP
ncbi:MAG: triphosphoribosyl-dephospho-CoA synthase [Thaumarchaeota archaeon]|nr:triphosphoribosyl-dephospho-CoA synthase [Candidatus Calditenuaceae archaeon]MCX8203313.1 triphosphoribosyl-dephospho-CoA synthase [Nitrososphaeria archaeon]MDW8043007.1 triphosphoribosyl-dephospho-CoA synthase [Nitrososphaerota archaeon]